MKKQINQQIRLYSNKNGANYKPSSTLPIDIEEAFKNESLF